MKQALMFCDRADELKSLMFSDRADELKSLMFSDRADELKSVSKVLSPGLHPFITFSIFAIEA